MRCNAGCKHSCFQLFDLLRDNDLLPELLLLEQLKVPERWTGISAHVVRFLHINSGRQRSGLRKILCVLWLREVLQVVKVSNELRVVKQLALCQVLKVVWIGKALNELEIRNTCISKG